MKHGESPTILQAGQMQLYVKRQKIWGCGFCITYQTEWKDFAKHIWSHFQDGKVKANWNTSVCIHSLLHFPSVRSDWYTLVGRHMGEDKQRITQLQWSDSSIKLLLKDLEWDHADRQSGFALAQKAFQLSHMATANILPHQGDYSICLPYRDQQTSLSALIEPGLEAFNWPTLFGTTGQLPISPPVSDPPSQSIPVTQHSDCLNTSGTIMTSVSSTGLMTTPETGLANTQANPQLGDDFGPGDFGWLEWMSELISIDADFEHEVDERWGGCAWS